MKIRIVYDKFTRNKKLNTGWGVSYLIDKNILFDTGDNGEKLVHNLKISGIKIEKIQAVVISHDHYDHTGGLIEILKRQPGITVYVCPKVSSVLKKNIIKFQGKLIEIEKLTDIKKNIFILPQMKGIHKLRAIYEQSIVIKTRNGLTVITGCAHPGILKIVNIVRDFFPHELIHSVFGGFHLSKKSENEISELVYDMEMLDIENIGPTHCSGINAENQFKKHYKKKYLQVVVGETIEI